MIKNFDAARCLYSLEEVSEATQTLAKSINHFYKDRECLILYLLNGSVVFVGQLLPYLSMHSKIDYIHASRYSADDQPGELIIHAEPMSQLEGKHVLILDDIFDHGVTLNAVQDYCLSKKAASVESAVLVFKELENTSIREHLSLPKFCALKIPDYFIFGCGMDVSGYGRNAPGIYHFPTE